MMKSALIIIFISLAQLIYSQSDSLYRSHFSFSMPYINGFNFEANDTVRKNWGFWGISTEFEYGNYRRAWVFQIGGITDFFAPIGPADIEGRYESLNTVYINISRKQISKYFILINQYEWSFPAEFSYGINYSRYNWKSNDTFSENYIVDQVTEHSFGAQISLLCYFSKRFFISYQYRPTFFNLNSQDKYNYHHSMSFGFGIKI